MLNEWAKKDDIKIYTDKYLRLNQTEQELLDCVKRLRPSSQIITETEGPRNQDEPEHLSPQRLQITQGGSSFQDSNLISMGSSLRGTLLARNKASSVNSEKKDLNYEEVLLADVL